MILIERQQQHAENLRTPRLHLAALMKHLGGPAGWIATQGADRPPSRETWMKQVMGHYGLGEQSDVVKELRSLGYIH